AGVRPTSLVGGPAGGPDDRGGPRTVWDIDVSSRAAGSGGKGAAGPGMPCRAPREVRGTAYQVPPVRAGAPGAGRPPALGGSGAGQRADSTSDCAVARRSAGSAPVTMSAVALPSGPQTAFICGMFGIGVPPSAAWPQASMSALSAETCS